MHVCSSVPHIPAQGVFVVYCKEYWNNSFEGLDFERHLDSHTASVFRLCKFRPSLSSLVCYLWRIDFNSLKVYSSPRRPQCFILSEKVGNTGSPSPTALHPFIMCLSGAFCWDWGRTSFLVSSLTPPGHCRLLLCGKTSHLQEGGSLRSSLLSLTSYGLWKS